MGVDRRIEGPVAGPTAFRAIVDEALTSVGHNLPRVIFELHHVLVAVELAGRTSRVGSVSSLEHDDRDHQGFGEAGGESGGICIGHCSGSCLWRQGTIPRATGARSV